jgi:hypothetical protein
MDDIGHKETKRLTIKDARRFALIAQETRGWAVELHTVTQLSNDKMIAWATYRNKPIRVIADEKGSMMALTQEECQLLGILALEVWPG